MYASLGRQLARDLPGLAAMAAMAPPERRFVPPEQALRQGASLAAAAVVLYPASSGDGVCLPLTVRSPRMRHHAGQVSLPGGRVDPSEDAEAAALREVSEELGFGLAPSSVLGRLTPLYVAPSDFVVAPIVAAVLERPTFRPCAREVSALLEASMEEFSVDRRLLCDVSGEGRPRVAPAFEVGGHRAWGATAMILAELAAVWAAAIGAA